MKIKSLIALFAVLVPALLRAQTVVNATTMTIMGRRINGGKLPA